MAASSDGFKYDWYTDKVKKLQQILPYPETFLKSATQLKYKHIVSDIHVSRENIDIKILNNLQSLIFEKYGKTYTNQNDDLLLTTIIGILNYSKLTIDEKNIIENNLFELSKIDKGTTFSSNVEKILIDKLNEEYVMLNNNTKNKPLIRTQKYGITFDKHQHTIMQKFIFEYNKVYNLCVDIWTIYPEMTTEWTLLKDVIYDILYRYNKNYSIQIIKKDIIEELKRRNEIYKKEREELLNTNKEWITKEKERIKQKFKDDMDKYKKTLNELQKKGIKEKILKPKREKLKIPKIQKIKKERRENIQKPAPDDLLKSAIFEFCKNLKENNKKKFDDNSFEFKMLYKEKNATIEIDKRCMNKDGIFIRSLGKLNCKKYKKIFEKYVTKINKKEFQHNCLLKYDSILKKYYFYVVFDKERKIISNRNTVCALDPGEKIFMTYYSPNEYGKIGDNTRNTILNLRKEISKTQMIIDKNINKKGTKLKNKKTLKKKKQKLHNKIKGFVNEIHKKGAKFLCEKYENIIIPPFETKPMLSKKKRIEEYKRIHEIENKEEAKKELKQLNNKVVLSKNVKYVLQNLSHYTFRNFLESKAEELGTIVCVSGEQFTSQSCIKCGCLSKEYDSRRNKKCPYCGYIVNRDIGGSRNILCKTLVQLLIKINKQPL